MNKCEFSLILPCYNEHEHILKSIDYIISHLKKLKIKWEILLIDDKSSDNTVELLNIIAKKYKTISVLTFLHKRNKGRGATVSEGIKKSKGEIVGYMDIDCEISPKYISMFINTLKKGVDIVVAKRKYEFNSKSIHRYFASSIYAFIAKNIFSLPISDSESGYKFFKRKKILPILKKTQDTHWFWDTEIIVRANLNGLIIKELPVVFKRRSDKTSTVRIFSDSIEYIKSLLKLKKELDSGSI